MRFPAALFALLLSTLAFAAGDPHYADELVAAARARHLAAHPEWLTQIHYLQRPLGLGYKSLVDSANFFLAADGKYNPANELEATLRAFFSDAVETDQSQNPQCRFRGRYDWLRQQLNFDGSRLPQQTCPRFDNWVQAIAPAQITLIFPSAYLNNPSSMFGHTLLRIDMPDQDERTRLISYAINFAAVTDESNGLLFAIHGLTGGYPGQFSIMPYYEKVKEYNDLENRDIWEYQLDFSAAEIARLLRHVWELGPAWYEYYFFDENCSYHLLRLLDVARPGMRLAERFPYVAIPSDTVRAVLEQEGMLRKAVYRPAALTRLNHRLHHMSDTEQDISLGLALGEFDSDDVRLTALPAPRQALVLEAAQQYTVHQMQAGALPRDAAAPRALGLLRARAARPALDIAPEPPEPEARPDQGHASARLSLGIGSYDHATYQHLKLRPAYHDLLDPQPGYLEGSQINFADLELRHYPALDHWQVERLTLVDIASLSRRDRFIKPLSWTVSTGLERAPFTTPDRHPGAYLRGGVGLTWRLGATLDSYLLGEAAVHAGHTATGDTLLSVAPQLGIYWTPASAWRSHLRLGTYRYSTGPVRSVGAALLEQRYTLHRDSALRLRLSGRRENGMTLHDASLALQWYF